MRNDILKIKNVCREFNPTLAQETMFYYENFGKLNDNIYYYQKPEDNYLHLQGAQLCCVTRIMYQDNLVYLIVHDSNFEKLPDEVQTFFILHELGHIANNDFNNLSQEKIIRDNIKRMFGYLPKHEIKADLFAVSVMGVTEVKEVIKFLLTKTDLALLNKFDFIKRYIRIKKNIPCTN